MIRDAPTVMIVDDLQESDDVKIKIVVAQIHSVTRARAASVPPCQHHSRDPRQKAKDQLTSHRACDLHVRCRCRFPPHRARQTIRRARRRRQSRKANRRRSRNGRRGRCTFGRAARSYRRQPTNSRQSTRKPTSRFAIGKSSRLYRKRCRFGCRSACKCLVRTVRRSTSPPRGPSGADEQRRACRTARPTGTVSGVCCASR